MQTKTDNKTSLVLVSLNLNYANRNIKSSFNVVNKLTLVNLRKFIEGLSDKDIGNYVKENTFEPLISDIGYEININQLNSLKQIVKRHIGITTSTHMGIHNFINRIKETNSDVLYNELCEMFNTFQSNKKEIILRDFISSPEIPYDLIACQEVTKESLSRNLITNKNYMKFALEPQGNAGFYSDFLINGNIKKDISFERISDDIDSLKDYIWKQVYDRYGFIYDDNCDKRFPNGYLSECYLELNGTKIRIINYHRVITTMNNNRFLPFTLFMLSYLKAIQVKYIDVGIILLGDFNGDKDKEGNKSFFNTLNDELALTEVIDKERKSTYYKIGEKDGQKLDHVFVSSLISEKFNVTLTIDDSVNLFSPTLNKEKAFTDHSALILVIEPK